MSYANKRGLHRFGALEDADLHDLITLPKIEEICEQFYIGNSHEALRSAKHDLGLDAKLLFWQLVKRASFRNILDKFSTGKYIVNDEYIEKQRSEQNRLDVVVDHAQDAVFFGKDYCYLIYYNVVSASFGYSSSRPDVFLPKATIFEKVNDDWEQISNEIRPNNSDYRITNYYDNDLLDIRFYIYRSAIELVLEKFYLDLLYLYREI